MENKAYLYKRNGQYILLDRDKLEFYKIGTQLGDKINALDEAVKNDILNQVIANKGTQKKDLSEKKANKYAVSDKKCTRLIMVITQYCNLKCTYCYADEGTYGETSKCKEMSYETAKNVIDSFLEMFPEGIGMIQFFGGEPLLNYKLIEKVCEYCNEVFKVKGLEVPQFTISTNATLINEEIIDLFNRYNISVTVSIDGNKRVTDMQRLHKNPSISVYDSVIDKIKNMNKQRKFMLSVELTVTQNLIDNLSEEMSEEGIVVQLHKLGVDNVHVVPVSVQEGHFNCITDCSGLKDYMRYVIQYTLSTIETEKPIHLMKAAGFIETILNKVKKVNFCGAGTNTFAANVQGDVYGCFMLINDNRELCMGNVNEGITKEQLLANVDLYKNAKFDNVEECKGCFAKGICTSCIGSNYLLNGTFNSIDPKGCIAQKEIIEEVGLYVANKCVKETGECI